jgi:putative membrane-bound dehydrogenase-like protein
MPPPLHCAFRRVVAAVFAAGATIAAASSADSLATPDDLALTLFAAEPLLASPSDIDVDATGRVWVCEVVNYRGHNGARPEGDRILVLEDVDGDGVADRQTVFHQGRDVDSALGICVIGEGPGRKVIVSCSPDVFVFHDDDGDLMADRRETLFTKAGQAQHDHSMHAFVVGPDGRWYVAMGNTGHAVHDRDGKPVHDRFGNVVKDAGKPYRQGMVLRCRPDGGDVEVLGHNFRNNYEAAVDSFGGLWQSDNDDDGNRGVRILRVIDHGNYGYVDERTGAGWQSRRIGIEAETPERHWHLNDPGVMPPLLLTGGGSPAGICVYEGSLLPDRFHGALLHCDPGPNAVRAYRVQPRGAGYRADLEVVIDGTADRWFRPSDVCVAPDGSAIVADWHDPGVGGHGMRDIEKGRLYRLAPVGSRWHVPEVDFTSVAGAVKALASPNLCTRATALERLAAEPEAAAPTIAAAFAATTDPRLRARLAWAAGMLPGRAGEWIARLAADANPDLRCVALRMARLTRTDPVGIAELLASDRAAPVRREAAIALRGEDGDRADAVWAHLASRHSAGDRWETEALGLAADGTAGVDGPQLWDGRLAAWRAVAGPKWREPAGREIVWRSRGTASPEWIASLMADPAVSTPECVALARALDFQDTARTAAAVRAMLRGFTGDDEKRRALLPNLVLRLDAADTADTDLAARIDEAAGIVAGSELFVDLVRRFDLRGRLPEVLAIATGTATPDPLAAAAAGLVIEKERRRIDECVATGGPDAERLLAAVGIRGDGRCRELLTHAVTSAAEPLRPAAVRALARSKGGCEALVGIAKEGGLTGTLPQVAALAIAACPWTDVRTAAATVLPMPQSKGGDQLPPLSDLVKRKGNPEKGRLVFAGAGTCTKCHMVGTEGKAVGPALSGIGAKLAREAIYEAILAPSAAISHSYETWTVLLADGRSATGLLVSQTPEQVVVRGADGVDATFAAADIEELVKQPISLMPADLAAAVTADELVDLVAWLETQRATN